LQLDAGSFRRSSKRNAQSPDRLSIIRLYLRYFAFAELLQDALCFDGRSALLGWSGGRA
jgi:hypothetical protein